MASNYGGSVYTARKDWSAFRRPMPVTKWKRLAHHPARRDLPKRRGFLLESEADEGVSFCLLPSLVI